MFTIKVRDFLGLCFLAMVFTACSFGVNFSANAKGSSPMDDEVKNPKIRKPCVQYGLILKNSK